LDSVDLITVFNTPVKIKAKVNFTIEQAPKPRGEVEV
jgi:hypothetical protein